MSSQVQTGKKKRLPWHYIYFALAGFDIVTVGVSLYLNHRLVSMYNDSIAFNREWTARQQEVLSLGELSVALSAPGNDVFMTQDTKAEQEKFNQLYQKFITELDASNANIIKSLGVCKQKDSLRAPCTVGGDLAPMLEKVRSEVGHIQEITLRIFSNFSEGKAAEAANLMAQMDQMFARQSTHIFHAVKDIARIQTLLSDEQTQQAAILHKLEVLIFALATLMVTFAVVYGRNLAIEMKKEQSKLEEQNLRLEQQVEERTESLRQEIRKTLELRDQAQEASKAKTDFLANMSHELRTPLNSVIGHIQILAHENLTPEQAESFADIRRSAESLLGIVNDILDYSKIEAGEVILEHIGFDAYEHVRHIVQSLKPLAASKNLDLICEQDKDSLLVKGDPLRFTRIITNLLGNALRYTERGKVTISCSAKKRGENRYMIHCDVQDTGIGISKEALQKLFKKFTQADDTTTRKYGGTGFGLAITKELVEMMNGHIGVESKLGLGSRFWFEIEFDAADKVDPGINSLLHAEDNIIYTNRPAGEVKILLAEDHEMNQRFMQQLFKRLGINNYKIVTTGLAALNEVKNGDYDLVLMDCHMPEMNGLDATKEIRKLEDIKKREIPIIGITANAMAEDRKICLAIGMTDYLSKPIDVLLFKKTLAPWVSFSTAAPINTIPSTTNIPTLASIDLTNVIENSMGDEGFVREIVTLFVTDGAQQIKSLENHCIDGESHDWVEAAHALKGIAGAVGAEPLRLLCAEAQKMVSENASARKDALSRISSEYQKAVKCLVEKGMYSNE